MLVTYTWYFSQLAPRRGQVPRSSQHSTLVDSNPYTSHAHTDPVFLDGSDWGCLGHWTGVVRSYSEHLRDCRHDPFFPSQSITPNFAGYFMIWPILALSFPSPSSRMNEVCNSISKISLSTRSWCSFLPAGFTRSLSAEK